MVPRRSISRPSRFLDLLRLLPLLFLGAASSLSAQTIVISTLDDLAAGYRGPSYSGEGSHSATAQRFTTGAQAATLNSISPVFATGSGTGFTLSLYSNSADRPDAFITTLSGSTNPSAGTFTFTADSLPLLAANTSYWWLATVPATSTSSFDILLVSGTANTADSDWTAGEAFASPQSGSSFGTWTAVGGRAQQFTLSATAVPEPATAITLAGLIALAFTALRRRRR